MAEPERFGARILLTLACLTCIGSCRQIVGIGADRGGVKPAQPVGSAGTANPSGQNSDPGDSPGGSATPQPSTLCTAYCDAVTHNCTGQFSAYQTVSACFGVCKLLPAGEANDPDNTNSVRCRLRQAQKATASSNDRVNACAAAGPGGNGQCGSDCDAYCLLYEAVCQPDLALVSDASCRMLCPALKDQPTFDALPAADQVGDTVECRLVHVSNATLNASNLDAGNPSVDCQDAAVFTPLASACINNPGQAPTCDEYCRFLTAVCDGTGWAVYENVDQCLATCAVFDLGHNSDEGGQNTVGCRLFEAHKSVVDPVSYCPEAGPSGNDVCGDRPVPPNAPPATTYDPDAGVGATNNCDSYCKILHRACGARFDTEYAGDEDACSVACGRLIGATEFPYTVSRAMETFDPVNEYACRLLNSARALSVADYCDAAFGGAPCNGMKQK